MPESSLSSSGADRSDQDSSHGPSRVGRWFLLSIGRPRRPAWLILLTLLLLLMSLQLGVTGMTKLTMEPGEHIGRQLLDMAIVEPIDLRIQVALRADFEMTRAAPLAVTVWSWVRIAACLVLLFTVSSLLSRDARGRRLGLLSGYVTLFYHAGDLAFNWVFLRPHLLSVGRKLVQEVGTDGDGVMSRDALMSQVEWWPYEMLGQFVFGLLIGLLLLRNFRSRKARALFGPPDKAEDSGSV